MKKATVILFFLIGTIAFAYSQKKLIGNYQTHFNSTLNINRNGTFYLEFPLDTYLSWRSGTWTSKGDSVFLHFVIVYDTLVILNEQNKNYR